MNDNRISRSFAIQVRNAAAAAKNPKSSGYISLIRQFLKQSKNWPLWQSLTKNSNHLLEVLISLFTLVEYSADTILQTTEFEATDMQFMLLINGNIEVLYQEQEKSVSVKAESAAEVESKIHIQADKRSESLNSNTQSEEEEDDPDEDDYEDDDEDEECKEEEYDQVIDKDSIVPNYQSQRTYRSPTKSNSNCTRDSISFKQKGHQLKQLKTDSKMLLTSTKGKEYSHFSADDLDFSEAIIGTENRRCRKKLIFLSQLRTYRRSIKNKQIQSTPKSKLQSHHHHRQTSVDCNGRGFLSTIPANSSTRLTFQSTFTSGQVLNKNLLSIAAGGDIPGYSYTFTAVSQVSYFSLERDQIRTFMQKRAKHLRSYEEFLKKTLQQASLLSKREYEYVLKTYSLQENLKQDHIVIEKGISSSSTSKSNHSRISIFLVKEGFFELQTSEPIVQPGSISIVSQQTSTKQIIRLPSKSPQIEYQTKAVLQKGQFFGEEVLFSPTHEYLFTIKQKTPYSELIEFIINTNTFNYDFPPTFLAFLKKSYLEKKLTAFGSEQDLESSMLVSAMISKYTNPPSNATTTVPAETNKQELTSKIQQIQPEKFRSNLKQIVLNDQIHLKEQYIKTDLNDKNSRQNSSVIAGGGGGASIIPLQHNSQKSFKTIPVEGSATKSRTGTETTSPLPINTFSQTTVSVVPNNFRKNQFVKKNGKTFQSLSPDEATITSTTTTQQTPGGGGDSNQKPQSTSLHAFHQSPIAFKLKSASEQDVGVRTIRILFESLGSKTTTNELSSDPIIKGQTHSSNFDRNTINPPRLIATDNHINNSGLTRRKRGVGEVVMGRSLPRFKEILNSSSSPKSQDPIIHSSPSSNSVLQFDASISNVPTSSRTGSTSDSERALTHNLKGAKIKKMPTTLKQQTDHSKQRSALIKIMYEIEHQKWMKQQQQFKPASTTMIKQKFDGQHSSSYSPSMKYNGKQKSDGGTVYSSQQQSFTLNKRVMYPQNSSSYNHHNPDRIHQQDNYQSHQNYSRGSNSHDSNKAIKRVLISQEQPLNRSMKPFKSQSNSSSTSPSSASSQIVRKQIQTNKSTDSLISSHRGRATNDHSRQLITKADNKSIGQLTQTERQLSNSSMTLKKKKMIDQILDTSKNSITLPQSPQLTLRRLGANSAKAGSTSSASTNSKSPQPQKHLVPPSNRKSNSESSTTSSSSSSRKPTPKKVQDKRSRDHIETPLVAVGVEKEPRISTAEKEQNSLSKYMANLQLETIVEKRRGSKPSKNKQGDGGEQPLDPEQVLIEQNKLKAAEIKKIYQPSSVKTKKSPVVKQTTGDNIPTNQNQIIQRSNSPREKKSSPILAQSQKLQQSPSRPLKSRLQFNNSNEAITSTNSTTTTSNPIKKSPSSSSKSIKSPSQQKLNIK